MGFSAFVALRMAKEKDKEKMTLRPVEEEVVRLHKEGVEEVEEAQPVKVGNKSTDERKSDPRSKQNLKKRSQEPDLDDLIEQNTDPENEIEEGWSDSGVRRLPWGWAGLIALVFISGILWSLFQVGGSSDKNEKIADEAKTIIEDDMEEILEAENMIENIEKAVGSFFDSRSLDEMKMYVRDAESVGALMDDYYGDEVTFNPVDTDITSFDPLTIGMSAKFWVIGFLKSTGEKGQLLVEVESDSEVKVDWETYVCYQPMAWDDFALERPEGFVGDFRVYVDKDHFYNHEFADSGEWLSFRLTTLGSDEVLTGYVTVENLLGQRMTELIEENRRGQTSMILRLRIPEGVRSKHGVVIEKFLNPSWLYIDPPEVRKP
ncbi:MAG: hypothetical protein ACSHX7_07190 [Luteolibacter sp.]